MPFIYPLFVQNYQTFKDRVVEVIDQAQHFAVLGPAGTAGGSGGGGGGSGDAAQAFREGLDVTERECKFLFLSNVYDRFRS
jgi:hypothetical protein